MEEHTGTANTEQYTVLLETFLYNELYPHQQVLLFQQDGATDHTAQISVQVLWTVFPSRLISHSGVITWPSCSPDQTISSGAMLEAKCINYMKHILPVFRT